MMPGAVLQSEEACETSQKEYSPARLLEVCIKLVSENLDVVESFWGFPSLVGEKIFLAALTTWRMGETEYTNQTVKLFSEAYGSEFLSSLNVAGQHLGLNYHLERIFMFEDLVHLDVSDCGLGDNHEILTHLSSLSRLESLYLCNNCITDRGVQKLTLTYRMFGRGPEYLQLLNLSGNIELTRGCLKYLKPYPNLHKVILFDCVLIEIGKHCDWSIQQAEAAIVPAVHNTGWAGTLVAKWMKEARESVRNKALKNKSRFYSRPAIVPSHKTMSPIINSNYPTKCLVAYRLLQKADTSPKNTTLKCFHGEENDLMDMYSTITTVQQPQEKPNLLTGLAHCETKEIQIEESVTTSQSQDSLNMRIPPKHLPRSQKCSRFAQSAVLFDAAKTGISEKLNKKSNTCTTNHSTVLSYFKREDKQKCKENKPVMLHKVSAKPVVHYGQHFATLQNKTVHAASSSCTSSLSVVDKVTAKKRQATEELPYNREPVCKLFTGPAKKKRKIVIKKPQPNLIGGEGSISGGNTLKTKPSKGLSLLDRLDEWM